MPERWTRDSWRHKPIQQVPDYPDPQALAAVERQLATFPPLVFAGEARSLEQALGRVAMPASAIDWTSGRTLARRSEAVASALSVPAAICPTTVDPGEKNIVTRPARRSFTAWGLP